VATTEGREKESRGRERGGGIEREKDRERPLRTFANTSVGKAM